MTLKAHELRFNWKAVLIDFNTVGWTSLNHLLGGNLVDSGAQLWETTMHQLVQDLSHGQQLVRSHYDVRFHNSMGSIMALDCHAEKQKES